MAAFPAPPELGAGGGWRIVFGGFFLGALGGLRFGGLGGQNGGGFGGVGAALNVIGDIVFVDTPAGAAAFD